VINEWNKPRMNKEFKLISVIMPAYNCEKFIRQAIESILAQTYVHFELLIADEIRSKDNTRKIIDSYTDPRVKTFHNTEKLGYLKTTNKLLAFAKGDFITFQDADDYSHPNRLEILLDEFEKNKDLGACGSNYTRVDEKGNELFHSDFALKHEEIVKKMPVLFDFVGSGLMIKKEVYQQTGGYNEFFDNMGAEDFYWAYLISEKFKIKNNSKTLYFYRENRNSMGGRFSDNIHKFFSFKIAAFLINQRISTKTDCLELKQTSMLEDFVNKLKEPYISDSSLFFKECSVLYYNKKNYNAAVELSIRAIFKKPFKISLYRNFIYIFRKSFWIKIRHKK
jgi:glycosyltransferase involved in cell wall biosynthesis